jgi:DNA-binding protein H-NS
MNQARAPNHNLEERSTLMAKTLAQIEEQIAKLQEQKEAIKAKEVSGVVARIKEAIAHYGLAVEDLFGSQAGGRKGARTATVKSTKKAASKKAAGKRTGKGVRVPVKYRDDAGNTWTGRGNKPRWLVAALASGKAVDDFAVKV